MRVAITGGIGEGKSTILEWIREEGWSVHSSDQAARELFRTPQVNTTLAELAGEEGPISPSQLRRAMLDSVVVRRRVNALLHPLIHQASRTREEGFFEVPLLIEACLQNRYDEVWVVTCGAEEQRRRLLSRYEDSDLVDGLLAIQLPTKAKLVFADRVLRTNEPFEHVRSLLREALQILRTTVNGGA
jgi:dephospho-CoA kinase